MKISLRYGSIAMLVNLFFNNVNVIFSVSMEAVG